MLKPENKTKGGLIIPDNVDNLPQHYGQVISVGEDISTIKEGDIIVFHSRAGQIAIFDNVNYKALMYNEIYGVLEPETKKAQLWFAPIVLKNL